MHRWSKAVPRLQVECRRSPSDEFRDVKLRAGPDTLGNSATNRTIGHKNLEREKRNAKIRERFANGESQKEIGKDYGLARTSIVHICKGVERKAGRKAWKRLEPGEVEKRNATIRERFANGETQEAIGKDYDLTSQGISLICKGVERKVKPPIARNPEIEKRNARIRERYANGECQKAIGKDYNLTRQGISLICREIERKVKPTRARNPEIEARNARIRERYANGETQRALGRDCGLVQQTIANICKGVARKTGIVRISAMKIEERNARIRERFANGETQERIANEEGISAMHVYRICKGVERKVKSKKERNARIRDRYANGETQKAIGKDYGLSERSVYAICRGVERMVRARKPMAKNPEMEERNARIRERYANGATGKRIAIEEGLSRKYVYEICAGIHHRKSIRKKGRGRNHLIL